MKIFGIAPVNFTFLIFCFLLGLNPDTLSQDYVKGDFAVSEVSELFYQYPQLSVGPEGEMVLVWETSGSGDIFLRTLTEVGSNPGEERQVKAPFSTNTTRVAHTSSGSYMVMYGGLFADGWAVMAQVYDPSGVETGDTLRVDQNSKQIVSVAASTLSANRDNKFGAVLPVMDSMIVEWINEDGAIPGAFVSLNPTDQFFYEMTGMMLYSGNLIAVWNDGTTGLVQGQIYTPDGVTIGERFTIGDPEEFANISNLVLASDSSDRFVVCWVSTLNGRRDIYGQLMDGEGNKVGENLRISNESSVYRELHLAAAMDLDGKYVVSWSDARHGDTTCIYLQQVNQEGVPIGNNRKATTVNDQIAPGSVSMPSQTHPSIKLIKDTIFLAWSNYNPEIHHRTQIYANIQKWLVPDHTSVSQGMFQKRVLALYPNPVHDDAVITLNFNYSGALDLQLINASGQIVLQESRIVSGRKFPFSVSGIPPGVYHLLLRSDFFVEVTNIIVSR